jgi:hypothetical protein
MIVELKFDLNEGTNDTVEDVLTMLNASKVNCGIWEFRQYLREQMKWGDLPDAEYAVFEKVRQRFNELVPSED